MPLLHQSALLSGLASTLAIGLLLNLPLRAATPPPSEPTIPVRSLAGELAGVDEGTAVYIHTYYATGVGVLLSSRDWVVTARHTVLTPSGSFADEIAVGIAQMPLHNIVEVHVVAAAQDPSQDLVLLRPVQGVFPSAVQQAPSSHIPADSALEKQDSTLRRERQVEGGTVQTSRARRARPHPAARPAKPQAVGSAANPVAVHVVQDGPIARRQAVLPPAPHDVAVKRRVVEDGPLHAH